MATARQHVIVGTSGHIDHGKTALVRALTGTDTDRWEEEKRRGITIDLGFASLEIESGRVLGFVDVPGHERFVKNMLAGVGGIDVVLLVIAADESVMPQTREHFEICRLLGVRQGIVALTKSDLVDAEIVDLVKLEVEEFVAGSFLEQAPVIAVSSVTGLGLRELREALATAARAVQPRPSDGALRLPVDRVFTMKGFGTVVTGTMTSGCIRADDQVEILPGGQQARVRNIEVHDQVVSAVFAGQRTAVNLGGTSKAALERGMSLVEPKRFMTTTQFDAHIELLASAKPLKHGAPVHVHLATAETVGRAYLLEARGRQASLEPGAEAFVQLRLGHPLLAVCGDPFILRQFSPLATIAGGRVLHPQAPRHKQKDDWRPLLAAMHEGRIQEILELLCAERRYGIAGRELSALTGRSEEEWQRLAQSSASLDVLRETPLWVCARERVQEAGVRLLEVLEQFQKRNPLLPGASLEAIRTGAFGDAPEFFPHELVRQLQASGKLVRDGELVRTADHRIRLRADEQESRDRLVAAFEQAGLRVPVLKQFLPTLPIDGARAQRILAALLREGVLVRVNQELVFHSGAIGALRDRLAARRGTNITVQQFKTLADVSRKYAIPLLEHFDRQKVTLRDSDVRRVL